MVAVRRENEAIDAVRGIAARRCTGLGQGTAARLCSRYPAMLIARHSSNSATLHSGVKAPQVFISLHAR